MLFTCAPRSCAASRPASRKVVKRGNKSLAVDLHCHVHTPEADEIAKSTATSEPDPITRHGSQRTADRQKELRKELDQKLTSIEQKIYYDTMVFGHTQLEHLVNLWGADHVVIGTDYPYDMGYYKPVEFVNDTKSLTRAQKEAIIGGNAAKLLKLKKAKG